MEGDLLYRQGVTYADFTIRELCNIAYNLIVKQFQPPSDDDEPTVEDQVQEFEEEIGQRKSSATKAQEMLRANLIARGIDPDTVPDLDPDSALRKKMDEDALKQMGNEQLFFSGLLDSGKEFRGRTIKEKDFDMEL